MTAREKTEAKVKQRLGLWHSLSHSLYGLQSASPMTMNNHKKIQEMVRLRDITSPVDLLPGDACQAVWERIDHMDLCKDHKDLN
ncbi:hypothetical protein Y1Q_0013470 [Alligator mississippiensis]|uniref:Uncharacterized protein n=1 Tax=Alligator mississippiensis TaxID=8496 RepID=A0A151MSE6_ALLMI|nr:hypothetical protein Y1Q_0013470 [Alligator mississippiensis]